MSSGNVVLNNGGLLTSNVGRRRVRRKVNKVLKKKLTFFYFRWGDFDADPDFYKAH